MKAHLRLKNCTIEVEGSDQKSLFREMAKASEVFGESSCGLCGSESIRPTTRTSGKKNEFEYFEFTCENPKCRAKLTLGCAREGGGLFPKRKLTKEGEPNLDTGTFGEHRGWTRWRGPVAE